MQGTFIHELGINFVKVCLNNYWGHVSFFGIYIALIFCLLFSKKNELKMISIYTVFLFLTIFNPVLVKYVYSKFQLDDVYYRFFWLLPVSILLGYGCIRCIELGSSTLKRILLSLGIICMILFIGSPVKYFSSAFKIPDNLYKVPDEVLAVSGYIHQDSSEENPCAAVAPDLIMTLRQYDASIQLTLYRDIVLGWQGASNFHNNSENPWYQKQAAIMNVIYSGDISNPDAFMQAISDTSTEYLVYSNSIDIGTFLSEHQFTFVGQTEHYNIYRNDIT